MQGRLRTRSAWIGSGETSELIRCMIRSTIRSLSWGDTSCSERFQSRAGTRKVVPMKDSPKVLQYILVVTYYHGQFMSILVLFAGWGWPQWLGSYMQVTIRQLDGSYHFRRKYKLVMV